MTSIKYIFSKLLTHSSWAGISGIIAIIALFYSIVEMNKNPPDIEIIKPEIRNNSITFSLRNTLNKDIIIHDFKVDLIKQQSKNKCYSAIPIVYKLNISIKNNQFKVKGIVRNKNEVVLNVNEIIKKKSIEVFIFNIENVKILYKNKCNSDAFFVNLDMSYDNKNILIGGFKINEI